MATPESNALLAMQLMGAPFAQLNQQNDAKTNLLYKLTAMLREEQLKKDLLAEQDQRAFKLAEMQAGREDKRWASADSRATAAETARDTRQATQLEALQKREDSRATAAEDRQKVALEAADKKQIAAEMNRLYPQYAAAAARAGGEIKQRTDFDETHEGLGQLAADLKTAEVGYEQKRFEGAADAAISELQDARTALGGAKSRLTELSKPAAEDEKFARQRAATALKQAIDRGDIASATKLKPAAITKAITALTAGDRAIAQALIGDEAMAAFDAAFDQTLMALPNTKSRLQERAQAQQQVLQLQSAASHIESDLRKGAAANPVLAERLKTVRNPLDALMTPPEATSVPTRRTFDQVTPPATGSAASGIVPSVAPDPSIAEPGIIGRGLSALMNMTPGARTLQRTLGNAAESIRSPSTLGDVGGGLNALQNWFSPSPPDTIPSPERYGSDQTLDEIIRAINSPTRN